MEFLAPPSTKTPRPGAATGSSNKGWSSRSISTPGTGLTSRAGEHSTRHTLLSMYAARPEGDITLEEFESLALDRLRVLKGMEEVKLRNRSDAEVQEKTRELLEKHLHGANNEETARRDQLSHYILRVAYCRTPELRKWLLTQECELFRHRFMLLMTCDSDKRDFLQRSGLQYTALEQQEKEELVPEFVKVLQSQAMLKDRVQEEIAGTFYKVPFQAVPDLVAQRRVLLRRGNAFVSQRDLVSLVVQDFRKALSMGLADVNKHYREMFPEDDTRLRPLVAGLSTRYLGTTDYSSAALRHGGVSLATLPGLAQRHFPLCMQNLMTHVNTDRHLRHQGRQQLGLFLKAIGLPLEDALMFWRAAFAPNVPSDKFEKEYAYNIRHNYGKEGARKEYSAHNCLSIIRMSGGAADHHGCPYKRMDESSLRASLSRAGCDLSHIEEVAQKARGGHFQLACACSFEGLHKGAPLDTGVNHPAEYYSESRRVWEERQAAEAGQQPGGLGMQTPAPVRAPVSARS